MCNFHVGQKVVYVGPDLRFDKNPGKTVHVIQAIRKGACCAEFEIYVGVKIITDKPFIRCASCGSIRVTEHDFWKSSVSFRPLIEDYTDEQIEAVNIDEVIEPLLEPVTQ